MPRMRDIKVAVQKDFGASSTSAWESNDPDWRHLRYQVMDVIPLSGEEVMRFASVGFDANWKAIVKHPTPAILDGYRLVVFTESRGKILLRVVKSNPRGRIQEVMLKEVGAEQPA